jgi:tetratricopeptide (TPR) repeat protein
MNITLKLLMWCAAAAFSSAAAAALPSPLTDDTVLAKVPKRATKNNPAAENDIASAVRTAQTWIETARRDNDPRAYGYAQQALGPWWSQPNPPLDVLRLRAKIMQVDHHFDAARDDLLRIIALNPRDAQARLDLATLFTTTAHYRDARTQCDALKGISRGLIPAMCVAQIDGIEGDARGAIVRLNAALSAAPDAPATVRAWAMTSLAELYERVGDTTAAKAAYARALILDPSDPYTKIAFADFLLSQKSAPQVLALFREPIEKLPDAALLRVAIAARTLGTPDAIALAGTIRTRLAATGQRGPSPHLREEALLALKLDQSPQQAAELALKNWQTQKEPTDALLLLEAGRAAQHKEALATATQWLRSTRFEHPSIGALQ